ncbi:MAG: IS110 family transposase [Candidatus Omnitrophota bacterium]|jgi:transposase
MFYLGIDVALNTHRLVMLDDHGERVSSGISFQNNTADFEKVLAKLKELSINPDNSIAGLEATGNNWENLYCFLTGNKFKTTLLNPHQTNKFREALRKKAKTDDIDAFVIAGLLRSNEFVSSYVPEDKIQTLRELTKLRYEFIKDHKNYQRQVLALLNLIFPEYRKTALRNPFAIASIAIFKAFPTAKHLSIAKPKHIEKIVRSIKGNNFNVKEIENLISIAKTSVYSGRCQESRALTLNILITQVENFDKSIRQLEEQVNQILSPTSNDDVNSFPGSNLLTIPGVGPKTLAAILSCVGESGQAFSDGVKLIGHIGFFPQIYESGETKRTNKLSNKGPAYLRHALYMASVACIKHNLQLRSLYHMKISQGKKPKQALICVAKKLAHLCLSMLHSGQEYNPARVFCYA